MRQIVLAKRYLHLPVKTGAARRRMKVTVGGRIVDEFDIELAVGKPDFHVFLDVGKWKGKRAKIQAGRLAKGSKALAGIRQADDVPAAETLYKEKLRPQFHFSSRRGWNNDCNGLVYYKGEYHLYYQHNPYGWAWGNMHWGHAVSKDLVHWTELPIAIYPRRYGDWVYSGSAAVDWNNTGGFRTGRNDVIVAAYTSTGRGEAIAYSNDRGRTFTDCEHNPVVRHRGRDPRILRHAPSGQWVMAVYDERGRSRGIAFYTSPDLKAWQFASRIAGYFECPEIFELPVAGEAKKTRWIVYGADGNYAIGHFDGREFTKESGKHRFSYGNCFYASQTWSDVPPADGRRILIAWARIALPGMPFNQMMTFPVELTLRPTEAGLRVFAEPVRQIERLHARKHAWKNETLREGRNPLEGVTGELFHIRGEFALGRAEKVGLRIRGVPVVYSAARRELRCRRRRAPLPPDGGTIRLEILVDRASIEIFANGGRVYMPVGGILPDDDKSLAVFVEGGTARAASLTVHELRPAWP